MLRVWLPSGVDHFDRVAVGVVLGAGFAAAFVADDVHVVAILAELVGHAVAHFFLQHAAIDVVAALSAAVLRGADDDGVFAFDPVVVVGIVGLLIQRIGHAHGAVAVVGDGGGAIFRVGNLGKQAARK